MNRFIYISLLLLFSDICAHAQQESLFTGFAFNKLAINPASSGIDESASIFTNFRNQWNGLRGAPKTQSINYNSASDPSGHGYAIQLQADQIGIQKRYDISAFYSFGIDINASHIRLGTQLINSRYSVDYTSPDILALDGFDADPAFDRSVFSSSIYDVGLGIYYEHKHIQVGLAVNKLMGNKIKTGNPFINNSEQRHYYAFFGAHIKINELWDFKPQLLLKITDNSPYNLDLLNMFSYRKKVHLGLNIRSGGSQNARLESFDCLVAFEFSDKVLAGLSYDLNVSELKDVESGSMELFINYRFKQAETKDSLVDLIDSKLVNELKNDTTELLVEKEQEVVEKNSPLMNKLDSLVIEKHERLLSGEKILFNNILYEFNSHTIMEGAAKELDDLSKFLLEYPELKIKLTAYTDSRGSELYNLELSNKRALSAKDYLLNKGISPERIIAIGLGETNILNHCKEGVRCTEDEHNYNRRTEVQLLKN